MVEKHSELSGNTYAIFIPTLNPEEPDYIKVKPESPTGGRVYFIRFGAISSIDAVEPVKSNPDMPLPDEQEEEHYQIRRRPL